MDMAIYFFSGLSVRAFEVIVISFAKFLVTCLVSEIWKANDTTVAIRHLVL